jgi:hypothetical protein
MNIYTCDAVGNDGRPYSLRFLLTPQEAHHLQFVGAVPTLQRVVGMERVADEAVAMVEKKQGSVQ